MEEEEEEEDVIGCAPVFLVAAHRDEISQIIDTLPDICDNDNAVELQFERYRRLLDLYQEQPSLLDSQIERWTLQLIGNVSLRHAHLNKISTTSLLFLDHLTKVRGYKAMLRVLPHEIKYLHSLLFILENSNGNTSAEERYMMLLWLLIVSKNPFNFDRFLSVDGSSIVDRIIAICHGYLKGAVDKCQHAAIQLLASILTRPNVLDTHLSMAIDGCINRVKLASPDKTNEVQEISDLQLLFTLFKLGRRNDLLPFVSSVMECVCIKGDERDDWLVRKFRVKLVQRLGMTLLPPSTAEWRYRRGGRSLKENLKKNSPPVNSEESRIIQKNSTPVNSEEFRIIQKNSTAAMAVNGQCNGDRQPLNDSLTFDVPLRELEQVINFVLTNLRDRVTEVRWSAAKGVGRVATRLPRVLADDVLSSVLSQCFGQLNGQASWHGGCLALAELARRGVLHPDRLPQVVDVILKALVFEEPQGRHSVGDNVRDAACYCCWAFARAFDPEEVSSFVQTVAAALVTVAVFDREINIRRAASAAFQENVGRQGAFSHGIEIVVTIDYFAVGNRQRCFLQLAPIIARFPEYVRPLIDHLVNFKVVHWDQRVRLLSAEAMRRLLPLDWEYVQNSIVPKLMSLCQSTDVNRKQGAILAIAHTIAGLAELSPTILQQTETLAGLAELSPTILQQTETLAGLAELSPTILQQTETLAGLAELSPTILQQTETLAELPGGLAELSPTILQQTAILAELPGELMSICSKKTRSSGGEQIRLAMNVFMEHNPVRLSPEQLGIWWDLLMMNSRDESETIREGSARAGRALFRRCEIFPELMEVLRHRVRHQLLPSLLKANSERERIGSALLLGAVSFRMLSTPDDVMVCDDIVNGLVETIVRPRPFESKWAESRTACLETLVMIVEQLGIMDSTVIIDCVLCALDDYTKDNRGDIGRLLREAAMRAMRRLVVFLNGENISTDKLTLIIAKVLQQCCEKIDRTRQCAAETMTILVHHHQSLPIPCLEQLRLVFPLQHSTEARQINWLMGSCYDRLSPLLHCQPYFYHVLLGFVISAGGLTESLKRAASTALLNFVAQICQDRKAVDNLIETLLAIYQDFFRVIRITFPLMDVLDQLMTRRCFRLLEENPDGSRSFVRLIQLIAEEAEIPGNPQRSRMAVAVLCGVVQMEQPKSGVCRLAKSGVCRLAMQTILNLLASPLPVIRRNTAEELYETLVASNDLDETVLALLSETEWQSMDDHRLNSVRMEIVDRLFGVEKTA